MAKNYIGKRIRLQIGGEPPKDEPDTIVGSDTLVYMSEAEAAQYYRIVGEEVTLTIGDIDAEVNKLIEVARGSDNPKKEEIIQLGAEVLKDPNPQSKLEKVKTLITVASGIANLAMVVLELKNKLGL